MRDNGVFMVNLSGDAILEAGSIRGRCRQDATLSEFNVGDNAMVVTTGQGDQYFRFAGGGGDCVLNITDNALVDVEGDTVLGEDDSFTATCTLNMSGQLLTMTGHFEFPNDDQADVRGHCQPDRLPRGSRAGSRLRLRRGHRLWLLHTLRGSRFGGRRVPVRMCPPRGLDLLD